MLDDRLVRSISLGRCFALVGSGPSCEMGYPSWTELAQKTYDKLLSSGVVNDKSTYEDFLTKKEFPELFRQAEVDCGGRNELLTIIKPLVAPKDGQKDRVYNLLVKWPFRCYLTTNYDDEIAKHISKKGVYFITLRNGQDDLAKIRSDTSHIIVKLHSDLDHPDELILTSRDYDKYTSGNLGKYYRDRLSSIMAMFDICIIGHSLSDYDLSIVLQMARETALPEHPIYMITADFTRGKEREYLEKYNIVVTSYKNTDQKHSQLYRILSLADKFITPREKHTIHAKAPQPSHEEVDAAVALLLFRKLQKFRSANEAPPTEYIEPLMLKALEGIMKPGVTPEEIISRKPLASVCSSSTSIKDVVNTVLSDLTRHRLIEHSKGLFSLTQRGQEKIKEVAHERKLEEDQAYGQFVTTLRNLCPNLTPQQLQKARDTLRDTLVVVFKTRGLVIANNVFTEQTAQHQDLSDLFRAISEASSTLENSELRAFFAEAAHSFIVEPTPPQQKYLASLSQGYFLYNMIGLDPVCSKIRQSLFMNTAWMCDSSVLLPLIAKGCYNHEYAVDLFNRLYSQQACVYTTRMLLQEAWEHLEWAINFVKDNSPDSSAFSAAVLVKIGYKQNLFLDGYVRLSAEGRVGTFKDYLNYVCPSGVSRESFDNEFTQYAIAELGMSSLTEFEEQDESELEQIRESVQREREIRGTFLTELQVEAEAEVLYLIRHLSNKSHTIVGRTDPFSRIYFLSTSHILDLLKTQQKMNTWTPEALYRYLSILPGEDTDPDLLQKCMLNEYYYAGVSFIDKPRYLKFFGPSVSHAKASFSEQKESYLKETEQTYATPLDEAFERTPDLEKPLFVTQMGWRVVEAAERRAQAALARAAVAEAKVKQLQEEKDAAWKLKEKRRAEHEDGRKRNLHDLKHASKLIRQAKKRARKKK
ncbi:MAG: SIR2 family NAD-dependent protein deacylase [Planctomycetota bacterium]